MVRLALTQDDVIRFVRGEKPWGMLVSPGVSIEFVEGKLRAETSGKALATPTPADIARGFVQYKENAAALREWASVILAIDEIDLGALDRDPDGEALREALWDAASGDAIRPAEWARIVRLSD